MDGSKFSFELYLEYYLGIIFLPAHTLCMMCLSHHYKFIAVFDISLSEYECIIIFISNT